MNYVFSPTTKAFYPVELKARYSAAGTWPTDGIEVTEQVAHDFRAQAPAGKQLGANPEGYPAWVDAVATVLTFDQVKTQLEGTIQRAMDAAARARGYDSLASAISYADEATVVKFQTEGQAFRKWRSLVWAACYDFVSKASNDVTKLPDPGVVMSMLPMLELPAI